MSAIRKLPFLPFTRYRWFSPTSSKLCMKYVIFRSAKFPALVELTEHKSARQQNRNGTERWISCRTILKAIAEAKRPYARTVRKTSCTWDRGKYVVEITWVSAVVRFCIWDPSASFFRSTASVMIYLPREDAAMAYFSRSVARRSAS